MDLQSLKALGFSQGEIKVYTSILNSGVSAINKIHESTGLERRAIYDIINKLIEKGIITYTLESGKKTYQCTSPSMLEEKLGAKKEELSNFEKILPDIKNIFNATKPDVSFGIFRGKKGLKSVFEDLLNYKNVYAIGGGFYLVKELSNYWPNYNKRRKKLGCIWHNLLRWELRKRVPERELIKIKFLPKEFSRNPVVIVIFGNKVANLVWGEEWFAFVIESKEVAENYKRYHQYLWKNVAKY